jgi:hypothetical protein
MGTWSFLEEKRPERGVDTSAVGIGTCYVLDGPGIEFRLGEIFLTRPNWPWDIQFTQDPSTHVMTTLELFAIFVSHTTMLPAVVEVRVFLCARCLDAVAVTLRQE